MIHERVIERPPSAELAPDQQDTDSLPPGEIRGPVLERRVDRNECQHRQAPPGVKITRRAFGRDWRYPLTGGFWPQPIVVTVNRIRKSGENYSTVTPFAAFC